MTLQSTGAISLENIRFEFAKTTPISLSDYYGAAIGIPITGQISLSQFYGKSFPGYWYLEYSGFSSSSGALNNIVINDIKIAPFSGQNGTFNEIFVAGYVSGAGGVESTQDSILLRLSSDAKTIEWAKGLGKGKGGITFQGLEGSDTFTSIARDAQNNVYARGVSYYGEETRSYDLTVARFTPLGAVSWQKRIGNVNRESDGGSISLSTTSNVFVTTTGRQVNAISADTDVCVVKYNSTGTLQWTRAFGGNSSDNIRDSAISINEEAVYSIFSSTSTNASLPFGGSAIHAAFVKHNTSGTVLLQRYIAPPGTSQSLDPIKVDVDLGNNMYMACRYTPTISGFGSSRTILYKFNSSAVLQWRIAITIPQISGTNYSFPYSMKVDNTGNVYLLCVAIGSVPGTSVSGTRMILLRFNTQGSLVWQRSLHIQSSLTTTINFQLLGLNFNRAAADFLYLSISNTIIKLPTSAPPNGTIPLSAETSLVIQNGDHIVSSTTIGTVGGSQFVTKAWTVTEFTTTHTLYDVTISNTKRIGLI